MPIRTAKAARSKTSTRGTDAYLERYFELCGEFPLAPIRSKTELRAANGIAGELAVRGEDVLAPAELDYLEVLSDLIEDYEQKTLPDLTADAGDGVDILQSFLEDHGMTASDLGRLLGNRSLGSKILRRERRLTETHMRVLGQRFGTSPGIFLRG